MKDTFTFKDHAIGVKAFGGIPHFCGADIARACGYKAGLPVRLSDHPVKAGSFNYISLHRIGDVLGRPTGSRRVRAQDLLAAIEKEFALSLPVAPAPTTSVPIESEFDMRIKRNQLEMEALGLRAEEAEKQAQIFQMQKSLGETRARLYEREREIAVLQSQSPRLLTLGREKAVNG